MTPAEAREILKKHADPGDGFIGSLRPYTGLRQENFDEVMTAVRALEPEIGAETIDRELVSLLWWICMCGYSWGVHPGGMLQRNNLISTADAEKLGDWVESISYTVSGILECGSLSTPEDYDDNFAPP